MPRLLQHQHRPSTSVALWYLTIAPCSLSNGFVYDASDLTTRPTLASPQRLRAHADAAHADARVRAAAGNDATSNDKSDEELLAEKLASPSTSDQPLMPWLSPPNAAIEEELPWFAELGPDNNNIPFECTGCGKCCKTRGDVYMSPTETKKAAKLLGLSIADFKAQYVEEEEVTVTMSLDPEQIPEGETGWTVLRHKEEDQSCIFLNDEGLCNIYEARPIQCSTYPFWPRIMANREAWNSEVRLEGDAPEGMTNEDQYWTIEGGGCEGMHKIDVDGSSKSKISGISSADAEGRLAEYERYKRRFPTSELRSIRK